MFCSGCVCGAAEAIYRYRCDPAAFVVTRSLPGPADSNKVTDRSLIIVNDRSLANAAVMFYERGGFETVLPDCCPNPSCIPGFRASEFSDPSRIHCGYMTRFTIIPHRNENSMTKRIYRAKRFQPIAIFSAPRFVIFVAGPVIMKAAALPILIPPQSHC